MTVTMDIGLDAAYRHEAEVSVCTASEEREQVTVTCGCGESWDCELAAGTIEAESDQSHLAAWESHVLSAVVKAHGRDAAVAAYGQAWEAKEAQAWMTVHEGTDGQAVTMTARLWRNGKNTMIWERVSDQVQGDAAVQTFAAEVAAEIGFSPLGWSIVPDFEEGAQRWSWRSAVVSGTGRDRRRLCAHADQNGEGMHWLEPGEVCQKITAGALNVSEPTGWECVNCGRQCEHDGGYCNACIEAHEEDMHADAEDTDSCPGCGYSKYTEDSLCVDCRDVQKPPNESEKK